VAFLFILNLIPSNASDYIPSLMAVYRTVLRLLL
jgi:hypothetical protein